MQKAIIILILSSLISFVCSCSTARFFDSKGFKSKYPFAILGYDYGILNEEDLAINSCQAKEEPFPGESSPYPYWQCFSVKDVKIVCDPLQNDDDFKVKLTILDFEVGQKKENHDYLSRIAIEMKECLEVQEDFKRLTVGQINVCVSGSQAVHGTDDRGVDTTYWLFDKFKTKLGCNGYFGLCDWKLQNEKGCKLKP